MGTGVSVYLITTEKGENCWVILRQAEQEEFGQDGWNPEQCKKEAMDFVEQTIDSAPLRTLVKATPAGRIARTPLLDLEPLSTWHKGHCCLIG